MDPEQVERGKQWVTDLLDMAGFAADVSVIPSPAFSPDSCWLAIDETTLTTQQSQALMGDEGNVLDAMQYLVNSSVNLGQPAERQVAFTLDLAGYRVQRYEELKAIADAAAQEVRETGEEKELMPMSSAERRQVHTILKDYPDLETSSRGQEPNRCLVIRPLEG